MNWDKFPNPNLSKKENWIIKGMLIVICLGVLAMTTVYSLTLFFCGT
jgi:hypothetical protein